MALTKVWPDLEILQAFMMGLEVSFLGDFSSQSLKFFCRQVSKSLICRFFFSFGLWESNLSEFMGKAY